MPIDYQTYPPGGILASFVKCFWTMEHDAYEQQGRQRIVPDGCMELIIHYGDPFKQYLEDGTMIVQPKSFVFGQITRQLEIGPTGRAGIVAARFQPDGFIPFATMEISAMDNRAVPLTELYGESGTSLERDVMACRTSEERLDTISEFLSKRLASTEGTDALIKSCVDLLIRSKGQVAIDVLSAEMKSSRRKLERRFSSTVGLSPKQLSRIIRLQATLRLLKQQPHTSLTALAHDGGYFDQAHFIKDFKEFTGLTPKQFYADSLQMSALFLEKD